MLNCVIHFYTMNDMESLIKTPHEELSRKCTYLKELLGCLIKQNGRPTKSDEYLFPLEIKKEQNF